MKSIIISLLFASCASTEAQLEACFVKVDARMLAEGLDRCADYEWDVCPYKDEIVAKYREERRNCD